MPEAKPTQPKRDDRPVVYGYVLAITPDELEIAALHKEIVHFCRAAGFRLEHIITDRCIADDVVVRPGFAALLEALELDVSRAVVVPHVDHISKDDRARDHLYRRIRRTGCDVLCIEPEPGDAKADGGGKAWC